MTVKFLIVGFGRSGTSYISSYVNSTGVSCGHEDVFDVFGVSANKGDLQFESSWYAVPYLDYLDPKTKILHVVRSPRKVMESFYRIGLMSDSPWQHITKGQYWKFFLSAFKSPSAAFQRVLFVSAHRRFLKEHLDLSSCVDEISKLEAYWAQWNTAIESAVEKHDFPYLRVRIEDIVNQRRLVDEFLGLHCESILELPRNTKPGYVREISKQIHFSSSTVKLMKKYGYDN